MINYALVGTNDLERARAFYDGLFDVLGVGRLFDLPHETVWGRPAAMPTFGVITPFDGKAASVGNGTMVALGAPSRPVVDAVYRRAIELGAADEGPPGVRGPDPDFFYGAYFRDLDGNKLCICKFGRDTAET